MKLSEILENRVRTLWAEAAEKPFVREMAMGTLSEDRFRNYMIQDYLYLLDYIELLEKNREAAGEQSLKDFLTQVISETEDETYRVHVPNMKNIGIREEEISGCERPLVITEYVAYMQAQLENEGLLAGLAALLQCSWVYAFLGEVLTERYAEEIAVSPYKSWFDAYACTEYVEANQRWIDVLDREGAQISPEETETLCRIFETCAEYENRFWDSL